MATNDIKSDGDGDAEQQSPPGHSREKGSDSASSLDLVGTKLDSKGLPLVPQPSRFKDDPLVSF